MGEGVRDRLLVLVVILVVLIAPFPPFRLRGRGRGRGRFWLKVSALAILGPQMLVRLGGIGGFHVYPVPVEAAVHAFGEHGVKPEVGC